MEERLGKIRTRIGTLALIIRTTKRDELIVSCRQQLRDLNREFTALLRQQ